MPESCHFLQLRTETEQQRFSDVTGELVPLLKSGHVNDRKHHSQSTPKLIAPIILEIKATFKKIERNFAKYNISVNQQSAEVSGEVTEQKDVTEAIFHPALTNDSSNSSSIIEANSIKRSESRPRNAVRRLWAVARNPRRLVWVAIDKDDMEALIQKLSTLNFYLFSFLSTAQAKRLTQMVQEREMYNLQIMQELKDIKAYMEALTIKGTYDGNYDHFSTKKGKNLQIIAKEEKKSDDSSRSHLKTLAELKIRRMEAEQWEGDDMPSTQEEFQNMALDITAFRLPEKEPAASNHGKGTIASFHDRHVWVEWTQSSPDDEPFEEKVAEREERIALLVRMLCSEIPAEFRVLKCLGYVKSADDDNSVAFGVVFATPTDARSEPRVLTLRQLMKKQRMPPILARLSLSLVLARSLSSLHSVDWVHKSLNSDNIIFFENENGSFDLTLPYITGFSISRPSDRADMTEAPTCDPWSDIYRHPNAQFGEAKTVYRKSYDIYALGVIFTEITLWKPIEATLGIEDVKKTSRDELRGVQNRLLALTKGDGYGSEVRIGENDEVQEVVDLATICGTGNRDVIRSCLQARTVEKPEYRNEPWTKIHSRMQTIFSKQVEEKLSMMQMALS